LFSTNQMRGADTAIPHLELIALHQAADAAQLQTFRIWTRRCMTLSVLSTSHASLRERARKEQCRLGLPCKRPAAACQQQWQLNTEVRKVHHMRVSRNIMIEQNAFRPGPGLQLRPAGAEAVTASLGRATPDPAVFCSNLRSRRLCTESGSQLVQ
jgi:hypothetical protein